MRIEEDVRRAMDARLSALDADPARRTRVMRLIEKEEEPVKRKMTLSLAFALIAALALAGVAWAASINVFEYFASHDARLAPIAQDAVPATETPLSVESDELGESAVRFDSAYYDGQTLLVGIALENAHRAEPFEPTAEELAAMEPVAPGQMPIPSNGGEDAQAIAAFAACMEQGQACGLILYTVYPSDHIVTGEGVDVGPYEGREALSEEGSTLLLREMETPLPEAIRDRDSLELHMAIWQSESLWWFDGETLYEGSGRTQAGEAVCTVARSEAAFAVYSGEGAYEGVPVTLALRLSALHGELTVEAADDAFPAGPDGGAWYKVILLDESGRELRGQWREATGNRIDAGYAGFGYLPETITARIVTGSAGEEGGVAREPIELTRTE